MGETIRRGFQRDEPPNSAIHVFDAALLPRAMRIAEIGLDADRIELVVEEKFRPVVLRQRAAKRRRQGRKPVFKMIDSRLGRLCFLLGDEGKAGASFLSDQQIVFFVRKHKEVGFPVTILAALIDMKRPFSNRNAVFYVFQRPVRTSAPTAFAFCARQQVSPAIVVGSVDLSIDETIDGLMTDR